MKAQKSSSVFLLFFIFSLLIFIGCLKAPVLGPVLKMPKRLPPIVKEYKHITLNGDHAGMLDTGIYLKEWDHFSILATGRIDRGGSLWPLVKPEYGWPLMARIGEKNEFISPIKKDSNASILRLPYSGNLYLGIYDGFPDRYGEPKNPQAFENNTGFFSADIIVWEREDYVQITDFFQKMKKRDPNNKAIIDAIDIASKYKEVYLASKKASEEIEDTKQKIQELKQKPVKEKKQEITPAYKMKPEPQAKPESSKVEEVKENGITQLESKLAKLMEKFTQLENMKK